MAGRDAMREGALSCAGTAFTAAEWLREMGAEARRVEGTGVPFDKPKEEKKPRAPRKAKVRDTDPPPPPVPTQASLLNGESGE